MSVNIQPIEHAVPGRAADPRQAYDQLLDELESRARATAAKMGLDWAEVMLNRPHEDPARQALTLELFGLFDREHYLSAYKDVAASDSDPLLHYVLYGDGEGRWPNPHFNPMAYRKHFGPDGSGKVCFLYHYAVFGEALGLDSPGTFSAKRYFLCNPGLQAWVDRPMTHFLHLGKPAGLVLHHRVRMDRGQQVRLSQPPTRDRAKSLDPSLGINVIGPMDKVSGLGVSARGYLHGLRLAGAKPLGSCARQVEFPHQTSLDHDSLQLPAWVEGAPLNVLHMNGDTLPSLMNHGGRAMLENKYNIGVWYWELPVLRPEWQTSISAFDEFWAPTPFIADTLRRSTSKRVTVLPPYLDYLNTIEPHTPAPGEACRFVYCFDANSILERKNPGALLDAFRYAFPQNAAYDHVTLTFKITYPDHNNIEVKRLYAAAASDPRIRIIDQLLTDAELHHLIGTATAYVSPHRSEGLGLTVIEAMAAGVTVISTSYGGLGHFVNEHSALRAEHRLMEIGQDHSLYPAGFVWSDPKVESLANCLRQAIEDSDSLKARKQAAREFVLGYFCSDDLLERYRRELDRLYTAHP